MSARPKPNCGRRSLKTSSFFFSGLLLGLIANFIVMWWMIMILPRTKVPKKSGLIGAAIGAVAFELLKQLSTLIMSSATGSPAGAVFGPGNFRITPEGQLAIIDFGAVHPLPGGVPPIIGELVRAALDGDAETVHAGLTAEGFVRRNVTVDPDELLRYVTTFLEPLRHDRFTFSRDWMRDVAAVVQDPKGEAFRTGLKLNLPPQYLMIQRVWLGAVGVLCQLESEIEVREPMERWIPGLAPTD